MADQFQISYCTTGGTVTLLDNFVIGTRNATGIPGSLNTNLYPASYPTDPKIYNYGSYMNGAYGVKYISDLTSFTYASGDYLKLEVIGAVYEPTNNDTNWDMKLKCLTLADIDLTFPDNNVSKILTGATYMGYSGDPNCYFDLYYDTISGFTYSALGYKPNSEYFLWKYTDMWKYVSNNAVSDYNMTNPAHLTARWKDTGQSAWIWNGTFYTCQNLDTPSDTATLTPESTTGTTLSFTSSVDYNKFVSNIASITGSTGYAQYLTSTPTDLIYYAYYFISWPYAPSNCGDSVSRYYLYIGFGSQVIFNPGLKSIKFIYSIPDNGMATGLTCNDSYQMAQNQINNMNSTKFSPIDSAYRTTHVRDIDPVAAYYVTVVSSHNTEYGVAAYLKIYADASGSNGMINGIFDPTTTPGWMYDAGWKEWRLFRQYDEVTLTGTTPPTTTWSLRRQTFLRTDSQSDYDAGTWDDPVISGSI